jgi:hypothetical protein
MIASATGAAAVVVVIGVIISISLYMLPTIVGATRKVVNIGSVFAINLLLGWTLIGWVVALAMALRTNPPYAYPPSWQDPTPPRSRQDLFPGLPSSSPPPPAAPPTPAPGWYPDPTGVERWWDGTQWTPSTRQPSPDSDASPGG